MTRTSIGDELAPERANILIVDDRPDKLVVFRSILEELGQNLVVAPFRRGGAEGGAEDRVRGDPARRQHAGHGRLRDGGADPRPQAVGAHADHLRHGDYADEVRTAKGYSLGAVDYILSPVVPDILRTKVKVFVDLFLLAQIAKRQARERGQLAAERAARTAAELANQRLAFLARASAALSGSLNLERDGPRAGPARRALPGRCRRAHGAGRQRIGRAGRKWCGPARPPGTRRTSNPRRPSIAPGGAKPSSA